MSQASLKVDEKFFTFPENLRNVIPENLHERSPFIKMKRLTEIDDSLLILNEQMSLNVSFTSPILESLEYLQQYEKYKLRSILSSFPLSTQQFDQYYNDIQSLIMLKYKSNITNMMKIVYELINVAGCEKINEMKMYSETFTKIKNQLLLNRKSTDVYGFDYSQFDHDKQCVKSILKFTEKYLNLHNHKTQEASTVKQHQNFRFQAKKHLESLTNKIKSTTIKMMDKMNDCQIQQPYIPQNIAYQKINVNKILQSYWKKMKIFNLSVQEELIKKRKAVQKQVKRLYQEGLLEYKQDTINFAQQIIEKYNQNMKNQQDNRYTLKPTNCNKNVITEPLCNEQNKRPVNVTDINDFNFQDHVENRSSIENIRKQVKFNNQLRFIEIDTKNQNIVEIKDSKQFPSNLSTKIKQQQQINIAIKVQYNPSVNPFLMKKSKKLQNLQNYLPQNYNQITQKEKNQPFKTKKILSRSENIDRLQKQFNEFKRKQEQSQKINFKRYERLKFSKQLYDGKSWIIQKLFNENQSIQKISSNHQNNGPQDIQSFNQVKAFMKKKIGNDEVSKTQQKSQSHRVIQNHKYFYYKTQQEKIQHYTGNFLLLSSQQKFRLQSAHENYQKEKMIEYERRIQSLIQVIRVKNYEKFCALSINPKTKKGGLDTKTFFSDGKSYRYGIEIQTNLQKYFASSNQHSSSQHSFVAIKLPPSTFQQLNKFFFYTFKELHYRFNKKIEENSEIPILMTLQTQQQILNEKMIKKILTLMKKYDFFILWTLGDLIFYEEKIQFGHRKAQIQIALFWGTQRIGKGLIWELKKRVDQTFKQQQNDNGQSDQSKQSQKQLKYSFEESYESQFLYSPTFSQKKETINEIFLKIQFVHRKIFDRHKKPLNLDKKITKGKQLWKELTERKWEK